LPSFSLYRLNPYDLILPQPIYATVDAVVEFAEEFTRLEAENSQLRKTIRSSADQVLEANRLATDAKNENVLLKEEVKKLKQRLKDELDAKHAAAAAIDKKEGALRESIRDLLGKAHSSPFFVLVFLLLIADLSFFQMLPT
jgi:regulator of replication initiation timing